MTKLIIFSEVDVVWGFNHFLQEVTHPLAGLIENLFVPPRHDCNQALITVIGSDFMLLLFLVEPDLLACLESLQNGNGSGLYVVQTLQKLQNLNTWDLIRRIFWKRRWVFVEDFHNFQDDVFKLLIALNWEIFVFKFMLKFIWLKEADVLGVIELRKLGLGLKTIWNVLFTRHFTIKPHKR